VTASLWPQCEIDINDGRRIPARYSAVSSHAIMIGSRSLMVVANVRKWLQAGDIWAGRYRHRYQWSGRSFRYHKATSIGPIIAIFFTKCPRMLIRAIGLPYDLYQGGV